MAVFTFNQDPVDSVLSIGGGSRADGVFTIGGAVDQAAEASAAASASDGAFSGFSGAETAGMGAAVLGNVLQGISAYQAAKRNFKTLWSNARETYAALEYNIGVQRRNNEQVFAKNRVAVNASGISAKSFTDVQRSNLIIAEDDIAAMREQVRRSVSTQLREAAEQQKRARKAAVGNAVGSVIGGALGAMTGNPTAAVMFANIGGQIGSSAGGK